MKAAVTGPLTKMFAGGDQIDQIAEGLDGAVDVAVDDDVAFGLQGKAAALMARRHSRDRPALPPRLMAPMLIAAVEPPVEEMKALAPEV